MASPTRTQQRFERILRELLADIHAVKDQLESRSWLASYDALVTATQRARARAESLSFAVSHGREETVPATLPSGSDFARELAGEEGHPAKQTRVYAAPRGRVR